MAEIQANGPEYDEADENSINILALISTLRRRRNTIISVSVGMFLFATIVAFLLPSVYTSSASFIPPNANSNSSMASTLAGQLSSLGAGDLLGTGGRQGDLYAGILRSRSIGSELVKRFKLMQIYKVNQESKAEEVLQANTVILVDARTSVVTINVTARTPALAQALATAYVDGLREVDGRLALGQASQRRLFFGQQLVAEKDDLENAEVELKKTEEQSGLIAPSGQTQAEIEAIAQTQAQIAVREVQLAAMRDSATDQNPEVIRLRSETQDLQGQLSRLQRGGGSNSTATIPTSKVPEIQLEYVRKEREVKYHEALFDMLSRQYEAARLDEARDAPVIQVLDSASYPDMKSGPKRSLIMLCGLVFGFVMSCVWVLSRDRILALRDSLASGSNA